KALGKSQSSEAFAILSKVIHTEQDWRVTCNIINALAKFEYDTVRALVAPFITNPNAHVSRTAAEFFIANGQVKDGDFYWRITRDHPNLPVLTQLALFRASNKFLSMRNEPESKFFVIDRVKAIFQQATNPYERAACMGALAEFGWNYRWIHDRGFNDPHPAVKSAAAEALLSIVQLPNFYAVFGENARAVRRDLYYYLREIVAGGDAGMIAAASEGFTVKTLDYKTLRDSSRLTVMKTALAKLKMPRDVEAYTALDKAIAYFEERPAPAAPKIAFNHPFEWAPFKKFTSKSTATIETSKGKIVLEMYPVWAPGSVANFLSLAESGYFNDKTFHRVVPNFVIQGGCPRGDGYGALDYTIRTEIGLAWYDSEGFLGMASAGPDTEGTQFFITHSATPHLSGRYTIFGKVKSGMDVVNQIQPGDTIGKVEIQY
ncbi:MAG: peptidylprolyl isomerase, partial [Saprospiraceae bacterium]|nr:peptidylprolyl isomerase [Saprospiraceae bacterium]